jgi:hypothetical protein
MCLFVTAPSPFSRSQAIFPFVELCFALPLRLLLTLSIQSIDNQNNSNVTPTQEDTMEGSGMFMFSACIYCRVIRIAVLALSLSLYS